MDGDRLLTVAAEAFGFADPRYTFREAADRAGVRFDLARRYWRALGFADPPDDEVMLTDEDVEALRLATKYLAPEFEEVSVAQARAICAALSRVADTWCDAFRRWRARGVAWDDLAPILTEEFTGDRMKELLDFVHRRLLLAAIRREVEADRAGGNTLAVGFVDLVGWTELTNTAELEDLAALVARFEGAAYDTIVAEGGRFVKLIGDEVMFTAGDVEAAVVIARRLVSGDDLPPRRAGVAAGPVVLYEGDCFGHAVNLASRAAEVGAPGAVVVDRDVEGAEPFGRRQLKGIGATDLWLVRA